MRTIRLNTILEGRLYQRGQFITFPWTTKLEMLTHHDISVVVNLWTRPDPELHMKKGLIYIHWPISGAEPPYPKKPMLNCLSEYLNSGYKMLVHCEAGVNRSVWLAATLSAMQQNISGEEALERIRADTHTKLRPGLINDLHKLQPRAFA